jgi:hypothetical protein
VALWPLLLFHRRLQHTLMAPCSVRGCYHDRALASFEWELLECRVSMLLRHAGHESVLFQLLLPAGVGVIGSGRADHCTDGLC